MKIQSLVLSLSLALASLTAVPANAGLVDLCDAAQAAQDNALRALRDAIAQHGITSPEAEIAMHNYTTIRRNTQQYCGAL